MVPAVPSKRSSGHVRTARSGRETLEKITRRLDETRLIGTRILVEPPIYRGLIVVAGSGPGNGAIRTACRIRRRTPCSATSTRSSADPMALAGRSAVPS